MKKGRRKRHCRPFIGLAKELLFQRHEWWDLSPAAKNIYMLLKGKYNGSNNGKIRLSYVEIRRLKIRGLKSKKSISRAFHELERAGWVKRESIGGLYRHINEYTLTAQFDRFVEVK